MSAAPPSQTGSGRLTAAPAAASSSPNQTEKTTAWRTTARARSSCPAPMRWATWTEKPVAAAAHRPLSSQVLLDTSPMAAEALAPRLPTMVASMYCMAVAEIWDSTAGMLRRMTACSWPRRVSVANRVGADMGSSCGYDSLALFGALFSVYPAGAGASIPPKRGISQNIRNLFAYRRFLQPGDGFAR